MTTLTYATSRVTFVVTGPDIEPLRFKTRREAKDWCSTHYPGSLIKEIGPIYKPPQRGAMSGEARGRGGLGAMTYTLERFPNVFCDNCRKVQPMIRCARSRRKEHPSSGGHRLRRVQIDHGNSVRQ
jgi:hypothetical protein